LNRNRVDKRDFNRGWSSMVISAIDLPATTANVLSLTNGMGQPLTHAADVVDISGRIP